MIEVRRTYNIDDVNKVMEHPRNVRVIRGDTPMKAKWPICDSIYYIGAYLTNQIIGLFIGFPRSVVMLECHIAMLPEGYRYTDRAVQKGIDWVRDNTEFKKLVGLTPVYNRLAIKSNERNGFEREGICKQSYLKDGKLYDQIYFGRLI